MKIFRELIIILTIYLLGETISRALNLPIPGNILGMILLFILLYTGAVKLKQIETVSNFLLSHLAFFFIPAGVGLLTAFAVIKDVWIKIVLICFMTTIITMSVTALIVQGIVNKKKEKKEDGGNNK